MLVHQLPELPNVETLVAMLDESLEWLEPGKAPIALAAPRARGTLESPAGMHLWGVGVPLDAIRLAATNHLLVELDYKGTHRVVEAYSLRRPATGSLLLFVAESGTKDEIKSFDVTGITNVSVTTRSFAPQWAIELVPGAAGLIAPVSRTPRRPTTRSRRRRF